MQKNKQEQIEDKTKNLLLEYIKYLNKQIKSPKK